MKQNSSREKVAWLAVLAVLMLITAGLLKVANATQAWLSEDAEAEQVAMQRPAPATNSVALPEEIQQQKQQMQGANPGGWASGQFRMEFTPGPAQQDYNKRKQGKELQQAPQAAPKKSKERPQYRQVEPDESMEEFWTPDYYDEGIDL